MNAQLAPLGLAAGVPLGFNDTYALAMREDQAQKLGIKTLSDLAKHPELKLGLSQEFLKRADGWPGVKAAYGLPFDAPQGLDHGLAYEAIAGGQIDVTDIYSTDSKIAKYQAARPGPTTSITSPPTTPCCCIAKTCRRACRAPGRRCKRCEGKITAPQMIALNAQVETAKPDAARRRRRLSSGQAPTAGTGGSDESATPGFWATLFAPDFWPETRQHLFLVFVSLALSILVAIPLGIWAARVAPRRPADSERHRPDPDHPVAGPAGVFDPPAAPDRAGPGHRRPVPVLAAAHRPQHLHRADRHRALPCASPPLALGLPSGRAAAPDRAAAGLAGDLRGIKTAAVINVGTATIAAFIGAGGYGNRISQGLENNDDLLLLSGAIPAAALALLVQYGFDLLDRAVVPKGLR